MTITLQPHQEQAIQAVISSGVFCSVDEFIDAAIAHMPEVIAPKAAPAFDKQRAQTAAARIRELRRGVTLGGLTIRELIDESRP